MYSVQGWFVIRGLALATINLPIKFEVSNSVHYEDTKCDVKFENRVLACLGLEFLQVRRLKCDLLTWYKITHKQTRCRPNGTKLYWPAVECYHGAIIRLEAA